MKHAAGPSTGRPRRGAGQPKVTLSGTRTVRVRSLETGGSEASKRVSIFDRETGSKPEMLRSGSLRADLNLIV